MTTRRRSGRNVRGWSAAAGLFVSLVLVAGCGSAAATSKPTAAPTAAATLPGEAPGGSGGGPFPTVGFAHDDPSLETLLPTTVNGVTLIHMSTDAVDEL